MEKIINLIILFSYYFIVKYISYNLVATNKIPSFINHLPFSCLVCFQTWSLFIGYLSIFYISNNWFILIIGTLLTAMNAVAMKIDQERKTIKV